MRHCLAYECGDTRVGVDDNGAGLAIERATDASRCSNALERKDRELFESEEGREWRSRDTSTIDKNVLCQCPALQQWVVIQHMTRFVSSFFFFPFTYFANIQ